MRVQAKLISLVMHFSCCLTYFTIWKLWADSPAANFNIHLKMQVVIGRPQFPWRPHSAFPPEKSVNSEWTWDYSYKLFPNLVISHFHAGKDIGLQVCREWKDERWQKKKKFDITLVWMTWHSVDCHWLLIFSELFTVAMRLVQKKNTVTVRVAVISQCLNQIQHM